jgi:opacity protein-like surface antigen
MRLLIATAMFLALALPAGAQERHRGGWKPHWGGGGHHYRKDDNAVGGFLGGVLGGYLWNQWTQANRPGRGEEVDAEWLESCTNRYRSFDRITGTYLGYDGQRHRCVL